MKLNLGAGTNTVPGFTNVDRVELPNIDVVHDLDEAPWPFEDSSIDMIIATDVFEHVEYPVLFMAECHRIMKSGAQLHLKVPYYRHPDAFTDPTHRRYCTEWTFDYWVPGTALFESFNSAYGGISFLKRYLSVGSAAIHVMLERIS